MLFQSPMLDFWAYMTVFLDPHIWYEGHGFYYSPIFAIFFFPFYWIGEEWWYNFCFIGICWSIYMTVKKLKWFSPFLIYILHNLILMELFLGNIDCWLLGIILYCWDCKNPSKKGIILGICSIKPHIFLMALFILLHEPQKREYFKSLCITTCIIWLPILLPIFFMDYINQLFYWNHPKGYLYLTGMFYPWFIIGSLYGSWKIYNQYIQTRKKREKKLHSTRMTGNQINFSYRNVLCSNLLSFRR